AAGGRALEPRLRRFDLALDDDRRRAAIDRRLYERVAIRAQSAHRDEHVPGLDRARIVAHGADFDVGFADQARAVEAVDELPEGHATRTRSLPDFVHRGKVQCGGEIGVASSENRSVNRVTEAACPAGGSCATTCPEPMTSI